MSSQSGGAPPSFSIIPPKAPKKPGMPKLSLPGVRTPTPSSSSSNAAPSTSKLGGLTLAIPTSNSLSSLSNPSTDDGDDDGFGFGMGGNHDEDPSGPGHPSMAAAASTIYPDTVPHADRRHPAALTNDLIRAIGGLHIDGVAGGSGSPDASDTALRLPIAGALRPGHAKTASVASVASHSSVATEEGEAEWVLRGNLEVIGRLGEGASGEVKKARHVPTGVVMAMKTISTSPNPAIHRQILRELAFNRTCHSDYIVRYYGAFLSDEDTSIVICMEHCEAGSLDGIYKMVRKRNGRTGEKVLGKVAEAGLKGLEYLRQRKIIHRDIKPSNILITRAGQIKLCDFGVSGELIDSMAGTFTGTSYYMAPERIKGLPYNISSDVWSLGLTILEVASNRFPFPPEGDQPLGPIDLLSYVVNMPVPELQDDEKAGIKWGRAMCDFVERCLEKDPSKRPGPTKMLTHPFVRKSETRQPQPDIARFVADVWGWPYTPAAGSEAATPTTDVATPATALPAAAALALPSLGRLPSVRQAPAAPVEALAAAPVAPSAAAPINTEKVAAKMREADVGLVGDWEG